MHDLVNQKKRIFLSGVFACFLTCLICILIATSGCETRPSREYGVFLGINGEETDRLKDYSLAVIEPSEFETENEFSFSPRWLQGGKMDFYACRMSRKGLK